MRPFAAALGLALAGTQAGCHIFNDCSSLQVTGSMVKFEEEGCSADLSEIGGSAILWMHPYGDFEWDVPLFHLSIPGPVYQGYRGSGTFLFTEEGEVGDIACGYADVVFRELDAELAVVEIVNGVVDIPLEGLGEGTITAVVEAER